MYIVFKTRNPATPSRLQLTLFHKRKILSEAPFVQYVKSDFVIWMTIKSIYIETNDQNYHLVWYWLLLQKHRLWFPFITVLFYYFWSIVLISSPLNFHFQLSYISFTSLLWFNLFVKIYKNMYIKQIVNILLANSKSDSSITSTNFSHALAKIC